MVAMKQLNVIVLSILTAITVLNAGLALNYFTSGQALAATFTSETIFLFAAVELAAVLTAYVIYKQRTFPARA